MASRSASLESEQPPAPFPGEPPKIISYEDMSVGSEIPLIIWKASTDPKLWDVKIDIIQPPETVWLTIYFIWPCMEVIWFKLRDKPLYNMFRKEFVG